MLSRSQVIPVSLVPWILLVLVALVAPGAMARADGEASDVGLIRTAKERLGVKASDEQRIDNCKVPIELRGAKSRPDECGDGAGTTMFVSCGPSTAQPVAVFNFELIDTSLEGAVRGARADEQERLARMSDQLRELPARPSRLPIRPQRAAIPVFSHETWQRDLARAENRGDRRSFKRRGWSPAAAILGSHARWFLI